MALVSIEDPSEHPTPRQVIGIQIGLAILGWCFVGLFWALAVFVPPLIARFAFGVAVGLRGLIP